MLRIAWRGNSHHSQDNLLGPEELGFAGAGPVSDMGRAGWPSAPLLTGCENVGKSGHLYILLFSSGKWDVMLQLGLMRVYFSQTH